MVGGRLFYCERAYAKSCLFQRIKTMIASLLFLALAAADPQAASAADRPERAADPRDKMICKKFLETGSLVKGYRVCKTKAEWEHDRDNIRAGFNSAAQCPTGNGGGCFQ
jgi:hypothetical protein